MNESRATPVRFDLLLLASVLALVALGHRVRLGSLFGSANSISVSLESLTGAADLRARGSGAAGY